ncbi:zinc finger HIT domain-containing protein 2 isoform X2 [Cylas formicarius]|uniref:zinc finger HIT domain-containing protein 2 isoform X2 n=1 Tax=Cylas formicarius TaxID=197179 RepID=UPI002958CB8E|nr:zinc finger HIT domain-containing protein 2 isoform X2 [Cylas formicarius]
MASAKIIELDETNTCKICDNALAKYSCPKCNVIYCSLTCYQSPAHLQCSEEFYKDNVMREMNLNPDNEESKAKMMEILQRTHEGNCSKFVDIEDLEEDLDSDDDQYVDIAERLAGIDLDDAETVWDRLTEDEKQDFVAFLKTENVSKLIPSWEPWWLYCDSSKVTEVNAVEDFKNKCPGIADIKAFSSITSATPAETVKHNLTNVLCAYVFTARYFNGEHFDFPKEASTCVTTVSLTLKNGQNFHDFETAVKSVEQECIGCEWIMTDSENLDLMREDLKKILAGPNSMEKKFYILCALSDLQNLFQNALRPRPDENGRTSGFNRQFPNNHFPNVQLESKNKLKNHLKKVDYFLSYSKDCLEL